VVQFLSNFFKTIRPKQALKNLALFAPLVFSGGLLIPEKFLTTLRGVIIFTIMTSSVYIFNDIIDLPKDRLHPYKKNRPIAKGSLPLPIALFISIIGFSTALQLAYWQGFFFFLTLFAYFILQILYSLCLKKIVIADILVIATGFVLRVYAGAFILGIHMSVWFLLCVISLALFLAAGKRRSELNIIAKSPLKLKTRETLVFYSPELLDSYLSMFANAAWLAYALFTFFYPPPALTRHFSFVTNLPLTLAGINKWLMITIPLVIFGIMRYLKIIYEGTKAESPEEVLLKDWPLLGVFFVWGIMVVGIIYGISP